ncbi:exported hypothetical protein [Candidatus Sulfopaludibacter sp. SbA4]|nr:exported hypothetical protein [Candidatus Sulfopaludibacter sp. SbA4]
MAAIPTTRRAPRRRSAYTLAPRPPLPLTSAPNPSTPGNTVTLTATVTPAAATGTVSFLDGATSLGTGSRANGVATFAISTLSAGSREEHQQHHQDEGQRHQ